MPKKGIRIGKINARTKEFLTLYASKSNKFRVSPPHERRWAGWWNGEQDILFHSKAEMNRFLELKILEDAGNIRKLNLQPKFTVHPGQELENGNVIKKEMYVGDFIYHENNVVVVEDVKGFETKEFKRKFPIVVSRYPNIDFRIIKK